MHCHYETLSSSTFWTWHFLKPWISNLLEWLMLYVVRARARISKIPRDVWRLDREFIFVKVYIWLLCSVLSMLYFTKLQPKIDMLRQKSRFKLTWRLWKTLTRAFIEFRVNARFILNRSEILGHNCIQRRVIKYFWDSMSGWQGTIDTKCAHRATTYIWYSQSCNRSK